MWYKLRAECNHDVFMATSKMGEHITACKVAPINKDCPIDVEFLKIEE